MNVVKSASASTALSNRATLASTLRKANAGQNNTRVIKFVMTITIMLAAIGMGAIAVARGTITSIARSANAWTARSKPRATSALKPFRRVASN